MPNMISAMLSSERARLILSCCVGALLGVLVAWCTNAAMVEISINEIFALYFGFFFLFLAGIIGWRVANFSAAANRTALFVLSALMAIAGLICVFYQRKWFFTLSVATRVPIYTILGTSLSFALTFAIAELLNFASSKGVNLSGPAPKAQSALIQTPRQIFLLASASMLAGFLYGLIFGFSELGKGVFALHTLRTQFLHEERICLPIGAVIGAVTAFLIQRSREADAMTSRPKPGNYAGFGSENVAASAPYRRGNGQPGDVDGGGPSGSNAFASSGVDEMDDFDPFPTTNTAKQRH